MWPMYYYVQICTHCIHACMHECIHVYNYDSNCVFCGNYVFAGINGGVLINNNLSIAKTTGGVFRLCGAATPAEERNSGKGLKLSFQLTQLM